MVRTLRRLLRGRGWALLLTAGVACPATGLLPAADARAVLGRVVPVLVFLVAITVVAEVASAAGVFEQAATRAARWGAGRTWLLWLLVCALATVCTVVLSLDTTAVLLTPVAIVLARRTGVDVALVATTTVWLAATASLLLPVSNLTNLLAADRLGLDVAGYARLLGLPAAVAVVATVAVLAGLFRRELRGRYRTAPTSPPPDRVWCVAAAIGCLALVPVFVSGLPVAVGAVAVAVVLVVTTALRRPSAVRRLELPWRMAFGSLGLFLLVEAALRHGLVDVVDAVAGTGDGPLDLLRLSTTAALAANTVNNLPAYFALEAAVDTPARLVAVLVGVDAGPLLTPWASLATLLWADRCRAAGVQVDWRRFVLRGLVLVPVVLVATTAAVVATT